MKLPQPKNPEKGFTLIELMIVIAIIAILVAIALPQLQTYMRKAEFSGVLAAASVPKTNMTALVQERDGGFPTSAEAKSYDTATADQPLSENVNGISADANGTDTIKICATATTGANSGLHADLQGKLVVYEGTADGGSVKWECNSNAAQKYLPGTCSFDSTVTCATS